MELETLISQSGRVKSSNTVSDGVVYSSKPGTISSIIQRRFQSFLIEGLKQDPSFVLQESKDFPANYETLFKKLQSLTSLLDNNPSASVLLRDVDPYSQLRKDVKYRYKIPVVTNASLKFVELMRFVQRHGGNLCVKSMFDNAALPGAFILMAKHMFETECTNSLDWVASSYVPKEESYALEDTYGLLKNERDRWMMDPHGEINGDVRDPMIIEKIAERVKERFPEGVELYTSDIGVESKGNHEVETFDLNYGQIVLGLMTLARGGTFIIKMFTATTPFTVSLMYNLASLFEKLYITKPLTSKQANSESYIVGIKFKGVDDRIKRDLLSNFSDLSVNKQFGDMKFPTRSQDSLFRAENVLIGAYQVQILQFIFYSLPRYNTNMGRSWNRVFISLRTKWLQDMNLKSSDTPLPRVQEIQQKPQSTRMLNEYSEVETPAQTAISTQPFQNTSYASSTTPMLSAPEPEGKAKRVKKKVEEKKPTRKIINIAPTTVNMFSYDPLEISPGETTQLYNKRMEIYKRLISSNINPLVADAESRIQTNIDKLDVTY